MEGYRFIKSEFLEDGIVILVINRPEALNALNMELLEELDSFIGKLPDHIRLLVLTGEGKAFVAGADIAQMAGFQPSEALEFARKGAGVFRKIEQLGIPVIAAINGFALGGGCELAMACDIRIASEKAKFGQPEVKLGIIPGFSGTYRLPKLVGQGYAKELIYSGRMIDGKEALRIGLVNHLLPAEELMDYVLGLARDIVANAPVAVRYAKTCINDNYDMDGRAAIEYENGIFAECFSTADQKEGMNAFLEKRKANFRNS